MTDLVAFSRQQIEQGSKSFAAAARIFDAETRASAYMLYAWCRHCDDVIDGQTLGFASGDPLNSAEALATVEELERKTLAACNGQADEPVFQALRSVCEMHAIPARFPLDLIAGFRMDAEDQHYDTPEQTLTYCYHVAGVVGVMMAMVMGVRDREVLLRASDLGIAFQLTNISRDVIDDHQAGRVYLPSSWLSDAGLTGEDMAAPGNRVALFAVTERLLRMAEPYYDSAGCGLAHLPTRSAWAVAAARSVYRAIGLEVLKRGPGAWDNRVSTGKTQKLVSVFNGLSAALSSRVPLSANAKPSREGLWTPDLPIA